MVFYYTNFFDTIKSGDIMLITSTSNEKIKNLIKLKEKKYRDTENLFYVEGIDLIQEAYKNNCLEKLYILENNPVPFDIEYTYITKEVMKKISDLESISPYFGVCKKIKERPYGNKIIALDNIQDPGNLGTIIRSACAFNFDTIILSEDTVDLYNPKTIRSTKGMLFNTNILVRPLKNLLEELTDYDIYGTDVTNGINIKEEQFKDKVVIVIGNEGKGLSNEVRNICNKFIYLPMNNSCESLNASVAASIIMYEVNNK